MTNPDKYNILFPVETINREIDYRLFLAVMFSAADRRIFIGQHNVLDHLALNMRGGLYVGKHLFKTEFPASMAYYHRLKARGFSLVHLDEEGGIYAGGEKDWCTMLDRRLDVTALNHDGRDFLCTWGEFQAGHYVARRPDLRQNIRVTGHPRFDLYKEPYRAFFENEVAMLRERYGRFVLLNTNLTQANNEFGLGDTFSERCGYEPDNPSRRMETVRLWAHVSRILSGFVLLVHRLSIAYPDMTFIVRPHPSEDREFYHTVFRGVRNIHVIHSGPVAPWIAACEALIHDGCTTAIEAFICGKPVINYKSVAEGRLDLRVPNKFGVRCASEEGVIHALGAIHSAGGGSSTGPVDAETSSLMANFEKDSFEALLRVMEEALAAVEVRPGAPSLAGIQARVLSGEAYRRIKQVAYPLLSPPRHRSHLALERHFYGFCRNTLGEKLSTIQRLLGRQVKVTWAGSSLIVVDAAG